MSQTSLHLHATCPNCGADNFAFQTVAGITHLRQSHPEMDADNVIAPYADALPELSSEGGCVFQGPLGRLLEQRHRADICNTFRRRYRRGGDCRL